MSGKIDQARVRLAQMFAGRQLSEMRVTGIQLWLRFSGLLATERTGENLDLLTSCCAEVRGAKEIENAVPQELTVLPYLARPGFLADAFILMEHPVQAVTLHDNGELRIFIDDKALVLFLTPDDLDFDYWVWQVAYELEDPALVESVSHVRCFPCSGFVEFEVS